MISAVGWVRKGAPQQLPSRYSRSMNINESESDNDEQMEDLDSNEPVIPLVEDEIVKKYNLDDYDDEDDIPSYVSPIYYTNGQKDPYLNQDSDEDEKEEIEDLSIRDTDALLLAASTEEDQFSHVNVYVYETSESNLYVHHDIVLPSFPLCIEWMSYHLPSNEPANPNLRQRCNSLAIGTFNPEIEIWDLDLLDALTPMCTLGGLEDQEAEMEDLASIAKATSSKKRKKKQKKMMKRSAARSLKPDSHSDSVMSLSWNSTVTNVLASGSADKTVKLWNLDTQQCLNTYTHHSGKVQAINWHPTESNLLLTAAYDKTASIVDIRSPNQVYKWKLTADVEGVQWNPHNPQEFLIGTEDGIVQCFDSLSPQQTHFTLQAHSSAVSGLSLNYKIPNCLATASPDKSLKIWDISDHKPTLVYSTDSMNAQLFSLSWNKDWPNLLAVGGKNHLQVIDTAQLEIIVKHFSEKQ